MALNLLPQAGQNLVLAGAILSIMLNPVLFALLEKYLAKTETLEEQTLEEAIEEEKQIPVDILIAPLLISCSTTKKGDIYNEAWVKDTNGFDILMGQFAHNIENIWGFKEVVIAGQEVPAGSRFRCAPRTPDQPVPEQPYGRCPAGR